MASKTQQGTVSEYFAVRGEYLRALDERNILDASGQIKAEILRGVFQPAPGDEHKWKEHCEKFPKDPMCLLGAARFDERGVSELFEVRSDYLSRIEEAGLTDVQRGISDMVTTGMVATGVGNAGLVTPDDPNADDIINDPRIGPVASQLAARLMF